MSELEPEDMEFEQCDYCGECYLADDSHDCEYEGEDM